MADEVGCGMAFIRVVFAYGLAVVVGTILVTAAATQITLQELVALGIDIPMNVRLESTMRDLAGFSPTLAPLLVIGFLAAFLAAAMVIHFVPSWRTIGYTLAGFATIIVVMAAVKFFINMQLYSGITPVPAARTLAGLMIMAAGGALAGLTFAATTRRD
ncbi:hypothetical protein JYU02_01015 [bacterium AH-315-P15]|nr:hypothetical protein [bacterium AH-315-P15]